MTTAAPAQTMILRQIWRTSNTISWRKTTFIDSMETLLIYACVSEEACGVSFVDVHIMHIVDNTIFSNVLYTRSKWTFLCYLKVSKAMIVPGDIYFPGYNFTGDVRVANALSSTRSDNLNPFIYSEKDIFPHDLNCWPVLQGLIWLYRSAPKCLLKELQAAFLMTLLIATNIKNMSRFRHFNSFFKPGTNKANIPHRFCFLIVSTLCPLDYNTRKRSENELKRLYARKMWFYWRSTVASDLRARFFWSRSSKRQRDQGHYENEHISS